MTTGAVKKATAMIEAIHALLDPDNLFLRYALIMGGLASISFGIIGTFVTIKRIGYLAGAISHSVFGGIGLAIFLQVNVGLTWFDPILGATLAAVISAVIIGLVSLHAKEREDTIIGTLWAVGMAAGILFIDRTAGYFNLSSSFVVLNSVRYKIIKNYFHIIGVSHYNNIRPDIKVHYNIHLYSIRLYSDHCI